ncbi:hypothetical protein [Fictibacillus gelatini]|uniref:portal protein n=1 Tax=Fictibacillus gelatini TaxID=225985 RepID=UPI000418CF7F|nr:hypothetical protein [Fictibacillus gelatini]
MSDKIMELASVVQNQYKEILSYKKQQGFHEKWAEYERFLSGDQWPPVTEKTKNLPRPVFNIINRIEKFKVSSVMNENIKMVFTAEDLDTEEGPYEGAERFSRLSDATWENIKQDKLNEEALEIAANTGTGIWHYYWDNSKTGGNVMKYKGEIAGEIIDPVNFFPGNPQNNDVQKQPYIIITHRDLVSNVRQEAESNGLSKELVALILPDSDTQDQAYDMAKQEVKGSDKCTVLTKYWKENGSIFFMKVVGNVVIKPKTNTRLKLYPLVIMQWERRRKSIFGIGDTEGLIPNQKGINFLMAMQLLSVQLTGWPKLVLDRSFVQNTPTNEPGEIISVNGVNGRIDSVVQYLNPGNISPVAQTLVESFMQFTKELTGANENALGEQSTAQMNATAIMLLQKASGIPIEAVKRRFYQAMEDVGRIWLEFWTTYYNMERTVALRDDEGESYTDSFVGTDYADVDMKLKIDIGPSSSYSESLMMTSLDKLFDTQQISLEQYLRYAPKNVIPFKDRLLKEVQEQQEQQQMLMQQQQEEQMMMQQQQEAENAPHPFDQELSKLPKHQQKNFEKLPPELQDQIMQQVVPPQQ